MSQSFDELFATLDGGSANVELSREIREMNSKLIDRAAQVGTAVGEVTIKLKFAATSNGRVEITYKSEIKRPGPPGVEETRWIGDKGELHVSDPRQETLPLRVPGKGTGVTS
jgi:hypothetical protein